LPINYGPPCAHPRLLPRRVGYDECQEGSSQHKGDGPIRGLLRLCEEWCSTKETG